MSYVCDVNGWSFVKGSRKYYDDTSNIITLYLLSSLRPRFTISNPSMGLGKVNSYGTEDSSIHSLSERSSPNLLEFSHTEVKNDENAPSKDELVCIVAVIRHGDRTPKQKIKLNVSDKRCLDFFHQNSKACRANLKLKSKLGLTSLLATAEAIIAERGEDTDLLHQWQQIRDVLTNHEIGGIYRKLQMKPQQWENVNITDANGVESVVERATQVELILKWGGMLTHLGKLQSTSLGADFRHKMYPDPAGGGVLRLHSTFRHDLKIRSSDEGRVMMTAAAFAKGLLELEGELTPLLASLVTIEDKDSHMLDVYDNNEVRNETANCKKTLNDLFQVDKDFTDEMISELQPDIAPSVREAMLRLGNPLRALQTIHSFIGTICKEIQVLGNLSVSSPNVENISQKSILSQNDIIADSDINGEEKDAYSTPSTPNINTATSLNLYLRETYSLMFDRWKKLNKSFFNAKTSIYDLTKVPELYDMCKYDVLHNSHCKFSVMEDLFEKSKLFAECVVPQEYGIDLPEKRAIGLKMCGPLLHKIKQDLSIAHANTEMDVAYQLDHSHSDELQIRTLHRRVRTRLYFTSESHLISLLNVLRTSKLASGEDVINSEGQRIVGAEKEISYLSHIVIRLFDNISPKGVINYSYCDILFSPGATSDALTEVTSEVTPSAVLNSSVSYDDLIRCLEVQM